jgi:hypothetical protein
MDPLPFVCHLGRLVFEDDCHRLSTLGQELCDGETEVVSADPEDVLGRSVGVITWVPASHVHEMVSDI